MFTKYVGTHILYYKFILKSKMFYSTVQLFWFQDSWEKGEGSDAHRQVTGPALKRLSHEMDFKNFDKNLQNLA
jgi:hypothetical protein